LAASGIVFNPSHSTLQRIVAKAQFSAVMQGQIVARTPHFALHQVALTVPLFNLAEPYLGVLVPKRWAKRAVTRNTIKRQIYAVSTDMSKQNPSPFQAVAYVVRLKSGFDRAEFISATSDKLKTAVRTELQQLFKTLA